MAHSLVELQQLYRGILVRVLCAPSRGAQGFQPVFEAYRLDLTGGGEVSRDCWDYGGPVSVMGVYEVVMLKPCSRGWWRGDVGENELDDDAGGEVNGYPRYGVLPWKAVGDFREILGACNNLKDNRCVRTVFYHKTDRKLTLGNHSCLLQTPFLVTGPASWPTRTIAAGTPLCSLASSSRRSETYFDSP